MIGIAFLQQYVWLWPLALVLFVLPRVVPVADILMRWLSNVFGFTGRVVRPVVRVSAGASRGTYRAAFRYRGTVLILAALSIFFFTFFKPKEYDFLGREKQAPSMIQRVVESGESFKRAGERRFLKGITLERLGWKYRNTIFKVCAIYLVCVYLLCWYLYGDFKKAAKGAVAGACVGAAVAATSLAAGASVPLAISYGVASHSAYCVGAASAYNYHAITWAFLGILLWIAWIAKQNIAGIERENILVEKNIAEIVQKGMTFTSDAASNPLTAAKIVVGGTLGGIIGLVVGGPAGACTGLYAGSHVAYTSTKIGTPNYVEEMRTVTEEVVGDIINPNINVLGLKISRSWWLNSIAPYFSFALKWASIVYAVLTFSDVVVRLISYGLAKVWPHKFAQVGLWYFIKESLKRFLNMLVEFGLADKSWQVDNLDVEVGFFDDLSKFIKASLNKLLGRGKDDSAPEFPSGKTPSIGSDTVINTVPVEKEELIEQI